MCVYIYIYIYISKSLTHQRSHFRSTIGYARAMRALFLQAIRKPPQISKQCQAELTPSSRKYKYICMYVCVCVCMSVYVWQSEHANRLCAGYAHIGRRHAIVLASFCLPIYPYICVYTYVVRRTS